MLASLLKSRLVRLGLPTVAVAAAFALGSWRGLPAAFLLLASLVLLLVLALLWSSLESLTGHAPLSLDEALGLSRPPAEEEQKQSVLRALKDLEYERSVGKISEEDYVALSRQYREEAKRLMLVLDERTRARKAAVEARVAAHLELSASRAAKGTEEASSQAQEAAKGTEETSSQAQEAAKEAKAKAGEG